MKKQKVIKFNNRNSIFISHKGNDKNNGNYNSPIRTLSKAFKLTNHNRRQIVGCGNDKFLDKITILDKVTISEFIAKKYKLYDPSDFPNIEKVLI